MIEENINKWLEENTPDGDGGGSIGEVILWYFVRDLIEGKETAQSRGEEMKRQLSTATEIDSLLKEYRQKEFKLENELQKLVGQYLAEGAVDPGPGKLREIRIIQETIRVLERVKR